MNHLIMLLLIFVSTVSYAEVTQGNRIYKGWSSSYNRPLTTSCPAYCDTVAIYSKAYGVPEKLIIAIIKNESNFNPKAVSHKGAKGLMQLMDINSQAAKINPFNPDENIRAGTELFARLLKRFNNIELALAAYNAGEGNVAKYGGIPPFPETKQYIKKVMAHYHSSSYR